MCGICGIIDLDGATGPHDEQRVRSMAARIVHRGPDATGVRVSPGGAIANCRLSIIDVTGGVQPVSNETGDRHVVFNGEIYNHGDLRPDLERAGHRLASQADTEVLVHLYEEHGEDMLEHLNGMFAFAVHDEAQQRWLLARDRLGIKPLFYRQVGRRIAFASEIKALLDAFDEPVEIEAEALELYLSLRYVPAPWTMFAGIRRLPPGHLLRVEARTGEISERAWWAPWDRVGAAPATSMGEAQQQIRALLSDAVKRRLMSDVPFGAFLSGGLDSSGVVALMAQHMDEPVQTFSIGFSEEARVDERAHARVVSEHCGTEHREVDCTADRVERLPQLLAHFDEPFADPIIVPTHQVSELARQHVKVVLTGEGADELFGGYTRYVRDRSIRRLGALPTGVRQLLAAAGEQLLPGHSVSRGLSMSLQSDAARALTWVTAFEPDELSGLGLPPAGAAQRLYAQLAQEVQGADSLQVLMHCEQRLRLPDCMLARTDRMTMAVSLEGRTPFLDHRLVEYVMSLPPKLKVAGGQEKVALKQALRPLLPASTIDRKKQGLAVPFAQWTRHGVEASIRRVLSPDRVRARGMFDAPVVARLLDHWGAHASRGAQQVWSLFCLELWCRLYLDGADALDPQTPLSEVA